MATTETIVNSDGGNTYSFSFAYLKTEDVKVELQEFDSTQSAGNQIISRQAITAFTVPTNNPTQIEFSAISSDTVYQTANGNVRTTSTNGYVVRVRIYRFTDADTTPATFTAGTSVRASDLNDNFEQILFIMQERQNTLETIQTGGIGENVITTAALQDDSVTADKLADSAVTDSARAVTTNHIRDNAVTTAKLNDSSVTTAKINDTNVTTAKLADGAVTEAKVSGNNGFVPTGAIFHFVASSVPTGYLKCNGDTIPNGSGTVQGVTADFSALYALVGATLPDLRGEFIRGWDDSRGVDSGRSIKTLQYATALRTAMNDWSDSDGASTDVNIIVGQSYANPDSIAGPNSVLLDSGNTLKTGDGTEMTSVMYDNVSLGGQNVALTQTVNWLTTRPRNVALLACIKY